MKYQKLEDLSRNAKTVLFHAMRKTSTINAIALFIKSESPEIEQESIEAAISELEQKEYIKAIKNRKEDSVLLTERFKALAIEALDKEENIADRTRFYNMHWRDKLFAILFFVA